MASAETAEEVNGVERLNRDCQCITLDRAALRAALDADLGDAALVSRLLETQPTLLAPYPVFLDRARLAQVTALVGALQAAVALPAYRERVFGAAPEIAHGDRAVRAGLLGFDFHLGLDRPRLIEINTNPGGALLGYYLARAQRACCAEVERAFRGSPALEQLPARLVELFRRELMESHPGRELRSLLVVDDRPSEQPLYAEQLLIARLLERAGIAAAVADAAELELSPAGEVVHDGRAVDLVYNRTTDFYFAAPEHAALARACQAGRTVVSPAPAAHALWANKRNLVLLSDSGWLLRNGLDETSAATLRGGVPRAELVLPERADELWARRKTLFFKPLAGFGSRGAYRGDKLTKRVFQEIMASDDYVAQELVPPSQRELLIDGERRTLKVDLRAVVAGGELLLVLARLYQGQTTNLRTAGGGLAAVFAAA